MLRGGKREEREEKERETVSAGALVWKVKGKSSFVSVSLKKRRPSRISVYGRESCGCDDDNQL